MTSNHVIQNYAQAVSCCVNMSSGNKGLNTPTQIIVTYMCGGDLNVS